MTKSTKAAYFLLGKSISGDHIKLPLDFEGQEIEGCLKKFSISDLVVIFCISE